VKKVFIPLIVSLLSLFSTLLMGEELYKLSKTINEEGSVYTLAFSSDGEKLLSGSDGGLKVWNSYSGQLEKNIFYFQKGWVTFGVYHALFSPDEKEIIAATRLIKKEEQEDSIRIWNAKNYRYLEKLQFIKPEDVEKTSKMEWEFDPSFRPYQPVSRVCYLSKTPTIVAAEDVNLLIWNKTKKEVVKKIRAHKGITLSVACSPDEKHVASGGDGSDQTIKIWSINTGKLMATLTGHEHAIGELAFSPNGKLLASVSYDKTLKIWDTISYKLLQSIQEDEEIETVTFSRDSRYIVTGSSTAIKIWDSQTRKLLQTIFEPAGTVSISFSKNGKRFATGGYQKIKIWSLRVL
jgi:WD40 repeat protein